MSGALFGHGIARGIVEPNSCFIYIYQNNIFIYSCNALSKLFNLFNSGVEGEWDEDVTLRTDNECLALNLENQPVENLIMESYLAEEYCATRWYETNKLEKFLVWIHSKIWLS